MRLVIVAQVLDRNDPVLGFFHRWCELFTREVEHLLVIAQQVGEVVLPDNAAVVTLGRETGAGRWEMLRRLTGELLRPRGRERPTAILAHMVPRLVLYAAPVALLRRIPQYLWYTHGSVDRSLRLAAPLVRKIFTASEESFRLDSAAARRVVTGHGIDCQLFAPAEGPRPVDLLCVGRLAPSKGQHELLAALELCPELPRTEIAGDILLARDEGYRAALEERARALGPRVRLLGAVPHPDMPGVMRRARILVSCSRTGSVDKAVLEGMASGTLPLTCNESFPRVLGPELAARLMFPPGDPAALAERVTTLLRLPEAQRIEWGERLRRIVLGDHDVRALIPRLVAEMRGER